MGSVNNEKSQSEGAGGCVSGRRRQTRSEAKKKGSNAVNILPPYNEMIIEAINEIMQRTKCSKHAITKNIRQKYMETLPSNFNNNLFKELKDLAEKGVLERTNNSFKFANGYKTATKSHTNQATNFVKMVFPTRVRSPKLRKNFTSANEIDDDDTDDAESTKVLEETQTAEATGTGSKVFIFKGTVQNAHFQ